MSLQNMANQNSKYENTNIKIKTFASGEFVSLIGLTHSLILTSSANL